MSSFLTKDVKNSKLYYFLYRKRIWICFMFVVLKYLDSLIKPVNVKAKLINFLFLAFSQSCPSKLLSNCVHMAFKFD